MWWGNKRGRWVICVSQKKSNHILFFFFFKCCDVTLYALNSMVDQRPEKERKTIKGVCGGTGQGPSDS